MFLGMLARDSGRGIARPTGRRIAERRVNTLLVWLETRKSDQIVVDSTCCDYAIKSIAGNVRVSALTGESLVRLPCYFEVFRLLAKGPCRDGRIYESHSR